MHDDADGTLWQEAYSLSAVAHADTKNLNSLVERDGVHREARVGFDSSQVLQLESTGDEEQPQELSALLIFSGFGSGVKAWAN